MTHYERHLQAAQGWLELGLPLEAHEELEQIEPEMRTLSAVLAVRVFIFQRLERWEHMEAVAKVLCERQPDEPQWFILLGYATRRAIGLPEVLAVLAQVVNRFPACATILYNLACYAAQLGHLDAARARLAEAINLEPRFRPVALEDADLAALHEELRAAGDDREKVDAPTEALARISRQDRQERRAGWTTLGRATTVRPWMNALLAPSSPPRPLTCSTRHAVSTLDGTRPWPAPRRACACRCSTSTGRVSG